MEASLVLAKGQGQRSDDTQGKRSSLDATSWLECNLGLLRVRGAPVEDEVLPGGAGTGRTTGRPPHPNVQAPSRQETRHSYQLKNSASRLGSHTTQRLRLAWLSSQEQASLCFCVTGGDACG